jgi:hypothetical protein
MQALTSLISYVMLAITPALAQATTPPAPGGDIPGYGSSWPSS